jgi:hypothetical protein
MYVFGMQEKILSGNASIFENFCLLGCDTVHSGGSVGTLNIAFLPP